MILVKLKDTTLYYYITVKFVEKKSTQLQVEIVDGYEADKLKNYIILVILVKSVVLVLILFSSLLFSLSLSLSLSKA